MYDLLKKRIQRESYTDKESMQVMLDKYYFAHRITDKEYEELAELLLAAKKA